MAQNVRVVQIDPRDVSLNMFTEEIRAARDRVGSANKLANALGVDQRTIFRWMGGGSVPNTKLSDLYFRAQRVGR